MRRIQNHRKLLGVDENVDLKEMKSIYRNLMKECHPDKFQDNHEEKIAAEDRSKKVIAAYHFLVSIAPETIELTKDEYNTTISNASIMDYEYKSEILRIVFSDGNEYEYYGVPKAIYVKFVNAETPARFARRHIFNEYTYRSTSKQVPAQ